MSRAPAVSAPGAPGRTAGDGGDDAPTATAATERRRRAALAGHRGDPEGARRSLVDPDPAVRSLAVGALARLRQLTAADVAAAIHDPSPQVRRRAVSESVGIGGKGSRSELPRALRGALSDPDPLVAEAAAWALGERRDRAAAPLLVDMATSHEDTRCREAAIGALGALGDPAGLPAVLAALNDKPTVRRRATVALSAFSGPAVEAALRRSAQDRDWQVREVAEILLGEPPK